MLLAKILNQSIIRDSNFNFIQNCLAIGLENYCLIKTKKSMRTWIEEFIGAEIISITPDYCPIIYGVDLLPIVDPLFS